LALTTLPSINVVRVTRTEPVSFCSHCGRGAASLDARTRICVRCELGLILQTERGLAPSPGDAFVVTDADLLICAVSAGAERLLGSDEPAIIHRPLGEHLAGVERDQYGRERLSELLRGAAARPIGVVQTVVGLPARAGEHYAARLGACGPPAAALLVIEGPVPFTGAAA
jgi:PAS domain-containing protein